MNHVCVGVCAAVYVCACVCVHVLCVYRTEDNFVESALSYLYTVPGVRLMASVLASAFSGCAILWAFIS